jgi:hypothetical protein
LLTVTGDPSRDTLDLAADYFDRQDAGEGFGAQIMRFSQPLIEAARGEADKIERAMTLGMIFWNMAMAGEDAEAMLTGPLEDLVPAGEDKADLLALAANMIERHKQMFPTLHAERRSRCASTEG